MQDRNNLINTIADLLGPDGSRELAEQVFDVLRADDRIYYTDANGLVLRDGVDLMAVAADVQAGTLIVSAQGGTQWHVSRGDEFLGSMEFGTIDADGQYEQDDDEVIEAARAQFGIAAGVPAEVR